MSEPRSDRSDRLDSWKAIAEYLQREERTVRRWEHLGLPVRRVARTRGKSVYAFASEIDAWLKSADKPAAPSGVAWIGPSALAALVVASILGGLAWHARNAIADARDLALQLTASGFVARDQDGAERWRYTLASDENVSDIHRSGAHPFALPAGQGVISGVNRVKKADGEPLSGRLFWFSPNGSLKRSFSFTREFAFTETTYGDPWLISDYAVHADHGSARVAVAGRQYVWWPAFVTILDEQWQSEGTFVNAGWIDEIHWLSSDRLIVTGFSNARNGGMVALLDAHALDGQSPTGPNSPFTCRSCGSDRPLRYIVLPRSEINLVTAASHNGAVLSVSGDRILVRTREMPPEGREAPEAIYEFARSFDLVRASFGDRYWDMHKALEREGTLDHSREQCPDRDGPRSIDVWEPSSGWRTAIVHH